MIKLRPATAKDVESFAFEEEQQEEKINISLDGMYSIVDEHNEALVIFKVIVFWEERGVFKSFFSKNCGHKFVSIVRLLKKLYSEYAPERLEVEVLKGFVQAERLVEFFGFYKEALMSSYYRGKDYFLYVKLKK